MGNKRPKLEPAKEITKNTAARARAINRLKGGEDFSSESYKGKKRPGNRLRNISRKSRKS